MSRQTHQAIPAAVRHRALTGGIIGLLLAVSVRAELVSIQPEVIRPDGNGVARFSVHVDGVPPPGLRSYALSLRFSGDAVRLVDRIDTLNRPLEPDRITCAARLGGGAANETVVPGVLAILRSGQGGLMLDSAGGGSALATTNRFDAKVAVYNVGIAGRLPGTGRGAGDLVDILCHVGEGLAPDAVVKVTPGAYPGVAGTVFLDRPGAGPVIDRYQAGVIVSRDAADPGAEPRPDPGCSSRFRRWQDRSDRRGRPPRKRRPSRQE